MMNQNEDEKYGRGIVAAAAALENFIGEKVAISPSTEKVDADTLTEKLGKEAFIGATAEISDKSGEMMIMKRADLDKIMIKAAGGKNHAEILEPGEQIFSKMVEAYAGAMSGSMLPAVKMFTPNPGELKEQLTKNDQEPVAYTFDAGGDQGELYLIPEGQDEGPKPGAVNAAKAASLLDAVQQAIDTTDDETFAVKTDATPFSMSDGAIKNPESTAVRTQVHPVRLQSFDKPVAASAPANDENFGLIQDVPLEISVQVGKTKKSVKDIMDLTNGSIVELDKQAGDPVDIIVNGQLIARGEVVVIDENFGVRVTEIIEKRSL